MSANGCWRDKCGLMPCKLPGILQQMPGGKVRLDPTVIRELQAFLLATTRHWVAQSNRTLSGLKGLDRVREAGKVAYAKHACSAVEYIVNRLLESVPVDQIEEFLAVWDRAAQAISPPAGDTKPDAPTDQTQTPGA